MKRHVGGKAIIVNHELRITAVLTLSIAGCILDPAKLGEEAESSSGMQTGDSSESDSITVTSTTPGDGASTTMPDDDELGIGGPCDHGKPADYVPESKLLTFPALDCEDLLCIYADIADPPADPCTSDAECNATNPELARFACSLEGRCEVSRAYFEARSMCSATCESDVDCATDETTNCQTGFSCVPITSLGEICCQPVCVCNDDLDFASTQDLTEACLNGTQEGCCDTQPGAGLCP